jgi:exodeoxyribonuclease-3
MPIAPTAPPYAARALAPAHGALRLLTWNINSVRLRLKVLVKLAKYAQPDVICLQETKTPDDLFPAKALAKAGFPHQAFHGDKGYNGVAILSRRPIARRDRRFWAGKEDSRHVAAEIDGIEIHNVYVPAGGDVADAALNPKFAHKLKFLEELGSGDVIAPTKATRVLVGDLNVAPYESDVWSHKQLLKVVSHTPVETDLLQRALKRLDWIDAVRHLHPEPQRIYTWWSYRNRDWKVGDRGRRLDHIWASPDLDARVQQVHVLRPCRDWKLCSDHVPVVADIAM